MKNLNKRLIQSARRTYKLLKAIFRIEQGKEEVIVHPYRGFTNGKRFFLKGRVLEDKNIQVQISDSRWRNLINTFKRFESDELPNAEVAVHINGETFSVTSDEEGYFSLYPELRRPLRPGEESWEQVRVELLGLPGREDAGASSKARLLFPPTQAAFGVISDIDDTVLRTHVTSTLGLRMLYATMLGNAHQRLPMEGIVELFQALEKGSEDEPVNPFFYVSNSPWNIYDMLVHFMHLQQLPVGPILLRDYGLSPANFSSAFREHKLDSMATILQTFPNLPFLLMGDTASKDVDHYLELARKYPRQIKTIYIRSLKDTYNARRVSRLIEEAADVDILLVRRTEEIWRDAREKGYLK
jgi:phosphatidate phosphatase APP1